MPLGLHADLSCLKSKALMNMEISMQFVKAIWTPIS